MSLNSKVVPVYVGKQGGRLYPVISAPTRTLDLLEQYSRAAKVIASPPTETWLRTMVVIRDVTDVKLNLEFGPIGYDVLRTFRAVFWESTMLGEGSVMMHTTDGRTHLCSDQPTLKIMMSGFFPGINFLETNNIPRLNSLDSLDLPVSYLEGWTVSVICSPEMLNHVIEDIYSRRFEQSVGQSASRSQIRTKPPKVDTPTNVPGTNDDILALNNRSLQEFNRSDAPTQNFDWKGSSETQQFLYAEYATNMKTGAVYEVLGRTSQRRQVVETLVGILAEK